MGYHADSADRDGVRIKLAGAISITGICPCCGNKFAVIEALNEDLSECGIEDTNLDGFDCPCGGYKIDANTGQASKDAHNVPTAEWQQRYIKATK